MAFSKDRKCSSKVLAGVFTISTVATVTSQGAFGAGNATREFLNGVANGGNVQQSSSSLGSFLKNYWTWFLFGSLVVIGAIIWAKRVSSLDSTEKIVESLRKENRKIILKGSDVIADVIKKARGNRNIVNNEDNISYRQFISEPSIDVDEKFEFLEYNPNSLTFKMRKGGPFRYIVQEFKLDDECNLCVENEMTEFRDSFLNKVAEQVLNKSKETYEYEKVSDYRDDIL